MQGDFQGLGPDFCAAELLVSTIRSAVFTIGSGSPPQLQSPTEYWGFARVGDQTTSKISALIRRS